jgi:Zn-dependent peptidase ImmA (M78 family)/transcriptional regulator with XRE-family HTH domain
MSRQEALVTPSVLKWARERARLSTEQAAEKIGQTVEEIEAWERGEKYPSIAQARKASEAYKRSLAVFYLPEPPTDFDPIKDFRQLPDVEAGQYSPELALLLRQLQSRQEWMREYLISQGAEPLGFIGSASIKDSPPELALTIRKTLGATIEAQCSTTGTQGALTYWVGLVEGFGVCVCREGKIELEEARGIALADKYAPFIYVNVKDSYAGREFTLLHELVHLWLNEPGVSNLKDIPKNPRSTDSKTEVFCNKTAALILVPPKDIDASWQQRNRDQSVDDQIEVISKQFRVSDETIARRLLDTNVIGQPDYERLRLVYTERWRASQDREKSGRPDYYRKVVSKNGRRFTRTVLGARYSGRITVREACLALGVKANNMEKLAETAGLYQARQDGGDR